MKDKGKLKSNLLKINQLLIDSDSTDKEKEIDLFRSIISSYIDNSIEQANGNTPLIYELEKIQLAYFRICDSSKDVTNIYIDILSDLINDLIDSELIKEV